MPSDKLRSVTPLSTKNQSPLAPHQPLPKAINPISITQPIYTSPLSNNHPPLYAPNPHQSNLIANPTANLKGRPSFYLPQQNYQYPPPAFLQNNYQQPYIPYTPSLSSVQSLPILPFNAQKTYGGLEYAPPNYPPTSVGNPYTNINGLKEPR